MPSFQDHYVAANGITTRYWTVGTGGTPLVLLHGLGGTIADWGGTMDALAQNRQVVAIDLLGNGRTDKPAGCTYTAEALRDHILSTLEALDLDTVDLNGWSLGGRVAIAVAHERPRGVRRLVLTAPAGIGPDTIVDLNAPYHDILRQMAIRPASSAWRIFSNAVRSGGARRLASFTARRLVLASDPRARHAFLQQMRGLVGPSGYLDGAREIILRKLSELEQPILVVWGREDYFAPFAHFAILKKFSPHAELAAIDRCGHTPHIEWPDVYSDAVNSFLR